MSVFEAALNWQKRGFAVLPIQYRDKRPEAKYLPDGDWLPFQTALPSVDELKRWFASDLHNVGLIVGWHNLVVIDFDSVAEYARWLLWSTREGGYTRRFAEKTYQVRTGRGVHVYAIPPHTEYNRKLPGVDIKAQRGYVLIPPSVHPSGAVYREMRPGALPMQISALSDILPVALLAQHVDPPAGVTSPKPQVILSDDPWASADRPQDYSIDLVTKIRSKFRIEDFFLDAEFTSRDHRWMTVKCPFHDDHQPSFWLDTTRQICGCYAGCTSKPLDVINLYGRLYGLSNRDAIYALIKGV